MNKTKEAIYNASVDVFSQFTPARQWMKLQCGPELPKELFYYHFKSKGRTFLFVQEGLSI